MNSPENSMLAAALELAERGFSVFPLEAGGKRPIGRLAPNGFKNATKNPDVIRSFWHEEPSANIGIACGAASGGLCVVDVDMHSDNGKEALAAWLHETGAVLPETVTAVTGGGGLHYYFRSEEPVNCKTSVMPGIDIKGEGGYVVAPPSIHASGIAYAWDEELSPSDVSIATANEVFHGIIARGEAEAKAERSKVGVGLITEGGRNIHLASYLGGLRRNGWSFEDLESAALEQNKRLSPPLEVAEALTVARSISRYPAIYDAIPDTEDTALVMLLERLAELHPEDERRYRNTEQGWGYLFADVFKGEVRYCPERKSWFAYDGKRWKNDPVSLVAGECAKRLADALHVYALRLPQNTREALLKGWSKWQKRSTRETILKDAAGVYPIALADLDANPFLLNVLNGTLDLETGELRPHSSDDLISKLAPVTYDPQAGFPRWERFIDEIMDGDEDTAKFLQKCMGYGLTGSTELEKMFILYGATSRNGKSTLMEAVLHVLGEYAAPADAEMLSINRNTAGGMKPTEDLAKLDGVRLVCMSEPPKGMRLNSAKLKQWTGSDTVRARFLNENSFEFRPQFKLYLNTNDLPTATDTALFKSGRMVVIPFTRHFTEAEQDNTLKQQFAADGAKSAILNWLLAGWQAVQSEGLLPPGSVTSAIQEYSVESDMVMRFVEECLEPDRYSAIKTSALLKTYLEWARTNGLEELNANTFKGELERAGFEVKRRRQKPSDNPTTLLIGYKYGSLPSGLFSN